MESDIVVGMQIRPVTLNDLDALVEIDGTVESNHYLHVARDGDGTQISWKIGERSLANRLIESNPLSDEQRFFARQIASGADEGVALLAEHDDQVIALLLAQPQADRRLMRIVDLRVDFDQRREGLASALLFQLMQTAREMELRAVAAETRSNNSPANQLMQKLGFELSGLDGQRYGADDLVKDSVALFWYAPLE